MSKIEKIECDNCARQRPRGSAGDNWLSISPMVYGIKLEIQKPGGIWQGDRLDFCGTRCLTEWFTSKGEMKDDTRMC